MDNEIPVTWSFSALKTFQQCARRYQHQYVLKDVKDSGNEATLYGTLVHEAIEDHLNGKTPLPEQHAKFMPAVKKVEDMDGDRYVEYKMALDYNLRPCDFDSADRFVRGIADVLVVNGTTARVLDWKGLALTEEIPTPSGFVTMRDLAVGDTVFDSNGEQCKVVGKSGIHNRECYEVKFDDKTSVVCDDVHLWKLYDGAVVSVTELAVGSKIAVCKPTQTEHKKLTVDPYILGLWIADGSSRSSSISKPDAFVWEEIARRGYVAGGDTSGKNNTCPTRTIYGLSRKLKAIGVLNNKHIPAEYLTASSAQRLDLIRGLMDGDGNANPTRKQAVFTTCDKRLSDDVKCLLESMGQRVNQAKTLQHGFGLTVTAYPLAFRPIGFNPFLLPRKADRINVEWGAGNSWYRKVVSVKKTAPVSTQCISVNSPDNTFLCTRNFIPTHNTGKSSKFADPKQLELMALMVFRHFPKVDKVRGGLVFLVVDQLVQATYLKKDQKLLWRKWIQDVQRIEVAKKSGTFSPSPSGLCGFCPVDGCEFKSNKRRY